VRALLVEVTAYGSSGSGTISGFRTGYAPARTTVLSYRPNTVTSNTAIIASGLWYNGTEYPSVSFLNRGAKPVQLIVSILGFFDDNTMVFGERYHATTPVRFLSTTMHADTTRTMYPGSHGNYWTASFNLKVTAAQPTRTTNLGIHASGFGWAPAHGQVNAPAGITVSSSALPVTGVNNKMVVHNAAGTVGVKIWSFGRFDIYPVPRYTPSYATAPATVALTPSSWVLAAQPS
jgi:hypothetical protein